MFSLAAQSSSGTSWVILIVVYAVIFGGFYMIFMRPQKKEQKSYGYINGNNFPTFADIQCILTV